MDRQNKDFDNGKQANAGKQQTEKCLGWMKFLPLYIFEFIILMLKYKSIGQY